LFALLRVLREHLAIDRTSAKHVPNGTTEDWIGHANDIEANVWSIELGKLARVDFRSTSCNVFSDHGASSLCYKGDLPARIFIPHPYEFLAASAVLPGASSRRKDGANLRYRAVHLMARTIEGSFRQVFSPLPTHRAASRLP
jgi:hypothetical protein